MALCQAFFLDGNTKHRYTFFTVFGRFFELVHTESYRERHVEAGEARVVGLAMGVSIGITVYFGNAALEKLEAIRLIGERSLVKVENAGQIVSATQPAVIRAADNSDTIVTQSNKALEEFAAL